MSNIIQAFPKGSGGSEITVDSELSTTSENPVQNKVITTELAKKIPYTPQGTTNELKDADTVETYCNRQSESSPWEGFRSITWSNIKASLKTYFDTLYSTVKSRGTPTSGGTALSLVTTGDMYNWNNPSIPVVANQFDKANIYSTTEKIVGCWTDGRPVYQKTVTTGAITPGQWDNGVAHNISNVKKFVNCFVAAANVEGTSIDGYFQGGGTYNNKATDVQIYADATKIYGYIGNSMTSARSLTVTLQYTKTTDAANSFKYADENDYSSTEHIVGTWIDGKPLYQKTINIGVLPNNTSKSVNHNISNLSRIIKMIGYAYRPSDIKFLTIPFVDTGNTIPVRLTGETTTVTVKTISDLSAFTECYVTIQYTKTTD